MKSISSLWLILAIIVSAPVAVADVLLIDTIAQEPVNSNEGVPRPAKGMSMSNVKERYGEPMNEIPRVGDPPISRWVYDQYTVYFEHNLVIHSVMNHR